ncbi:MULTISPECIES: MFS transporter [Kitasatospora]|uniref:Putative drug resistance protein n=1 Tax=Kitasatospora setae (strain ATCC 33774 / DSM 43861 / JCM 3304 / KCC A-0304 / NBRC 14216 / KM-6054) TaxID=452652 RepID=E4NA95_KITSK|nr:MULTISPECIES: MFS transporter [Kitasatospora]BAJ28126.1 putative drug resistance protein [Kitasatospora setae KM-6054]
MDDRATGTTGTTSARRKRQALATLCVTMFMAMLDNVIVNIALPRIGRDLDAGISGLQWVAEGYSLVYAALLLTGGTLGDRYGRTRVFRLGLALFTLGSAGAALAGGLGGIGALVAARMLQGVGAALLTPGSLAILRQVFTDERERARAIGLWSGVSALGLSVGPVVGGPMVDAFGWAGVFWINVPVGLVGLVLAYRVLPEVAPRPRRVDAVGLALSAGGLGALVYGLVEGTGRGWTDGRVLACGLAAAVLLGLFVLVELRVAEPMLELRMFRDRVLAGALLSGLMVSFGMFGALFFLPLMLQGVMRWSPTAAGYAGLPMSVVIVFAAPLSGRLTARYGPRRPLALGIALCAVGLGGLSLYSGQAHYWSYAWALVLLGLGMGLTFTPVSIAVLGRVAPERTGMASAAVNTLRELGGVLGIAVLGAVLTDRLTGALTGSLHRLGLPADGVPHAVAALAGHGAADAAPAVAPVRAAVDASFVDALHLALRCGSAALAATAVLVALLLRPSAVPSAAPAPTPAAPVPNPAPADAI